jgi:hypothetical protein
MANRFSKLKNTCLLTVVFILLLFSACSESKLDVVGEWISEENGLIRMHFYRDGTVSLSNTGFFKLRWRMENSQLVRIDAFESRMHFDFGISTDSKGAVGMLNLAGQSLRFRRSG